MNSIAFLLLLSLTSPTAATPAPAAPSVAGSGQPTYLVIYRPGPAWLPGKPLKQQPLREHGKYMLELFEAGNLRFAGGFGDDSGGALAFSAPNPDAALAIVQKDPAVVSGLFLYELHPWGLVDWSDRLAKSRAAEPKP